MSYRRDTLGLAVAVVAQLLIIAAAIVWSVFQWLECRDMGFSVFYCLQHII